MNAREYNEFVLGGGSVAVPPDVDDMPVGSTFETMAGTALVRMRVVDRIVGSSDEPTCTCVTTVIDYAH